MSRDIGRLIYEQKIESGKSYREIGRKLGLKLSPSAIRGRVRRYYLTNDLPPPQDSIEQNIVGGMDDEPYDQPSDIWQQALAEQEKQERIREWKSTRRIIYDSGPIVILFMADLHLGGSGTDYRSIDHDLMIIDDMAKRGVQIGVVLLGDLLDNFIIGRLKDLRMNQSPFLAVEEWGLVDYALERLAPHLIGSVSGNHDNWSWALVGVDLLRQRHEMLTPGILYDPLELAFTLQVGSFECRIMCRHDWRGHSMYNPTHGLEHGHHTLGRDFDIGVGAHTHRGGLAREFANGGDMPGYALICGTYKKHDQYAMAKGYPPPLKTSAVAAVIDEDGIAWATSQIWRLSKYVINGSNK